jgi:hypothetical protein
MTPCWHYVRTDSGAFYVLLYDKNLFQRHGFALLSKDQVWEGGLGCARSWEIVYPEEVPPDRRRALEPVVEWCEAPFRLLD